MILRSSVTCFVFNWCRRYPAGGLWAFGAIFLYPTSKQWRWK